MRINTLIFLLFVIIFSCEEPFEPDITGKSEYLVIDAIISNDTIPFKVTLSRSSGVDTVLFIPEIGALVEIIDTDGNVENLIDEGEGMYISQNKNLNGIIGKGYKVNIKTLNGNEYESDFQELLEPIEIGSLTYNKESYEVGEEDELTEGYKFYVSSETPQNSASHILWRMEETYQYHSEYKIEYLYIDTLYEFSNPDSLYTCWRTNEISQLYTFRAIENSIEKFPLIFVPKTSQRKLSNGYCLLLKQYTIDDKAYLFWNSLEDINNQGGGLFSQQPYRVVSNVRNINDPNEIVLGYFLIAGVDKHRVFAEPRLYSPGSITNCVIDALLLGNLLQWGGVGHYYIGTDENNGALGVISTKCADCRLRGGSLEKPDFWIY